MAPIARTRTFCCCIPVRAGVVIIALIGMLGGAGIVAMGAIYLSQNNGSKTSQGISVAIYTLLTIVSLFGLIGAISKKLGLIRMYFGVLLAHLLFSLAAGIYAIYRAFQDSPDYVHDCIRTSNSSDDSINKVCEDGSTLLKGLIVGAFIIAWLIEIWGCVIVHSYSEQLSDEAVNKHVLKDTETW